MSLTSSIDHHHFKRFQDCMPVVGAKRTIMCDVGRKRVVPITKDLYTILQEHSQDTIGAIKEVYGADNGSTIQEYFELLLEEEFIFLCDKEELDRFPDIELSWESPHIISNAIIDWDTNSNYDFQDIFDQLNELDCSDLLIRFLDTIAIKDITKILTLLSRTTIQNVQIIFRYTEEVGNKDAFTKLKSKFPRLASVIVYDALIEEEIEDETIPELIYTKQSLTPDTHCGYISPKTFRYNQSFFLESLFFNNCLNKKISISADGTIKNCPSMKESFGNCNDKKMSDVVLDTSFKKLWGIRKDEIEKCKDCEFRYICSDCRAFTEKGTLYSKPLHCGYDPYTAKWNLSPS
jgi:SPASM domain peptide maturase of grasp-with-spasm system